jgi:hypothetical protein
MEAWVHGSPTAYELTLLVAPDLHMTPFDTNHMVTAWIPLQDVSSIEDDGSGLVYAVGSHKDFALAFWYNPREKVCSKCDSLLNLIIALF